VRVDELWMNMNMNMHAQSGCQALMRADIPLEGERFTICCLTLEFVFNAN